MKLNKIYLKLYYITIFIILFASSCKEKENSIPYAKVDIYINVNSTQYIGLNSIGGWVYLTGGYRGIIVYRKSTEEFVAYERTCTYDPEIQTAKVQVENNGMIAIDSTCGSRFILIDGSVYSTPAKVGLKQYRTEFDGNILHIYN
ncbi:MAG TPA: hypothetical protein P5250_08145 [Bacteroidales bacterium]|mgnify:CR=1 FL=1|nr:hypothetical protein [Bacteroidales bacterium]